jgi:outer membrane protein assembly factor BamA
MVDVCVQVARGPRAVVRELAFDGNEAFDDAALASKCAIHIGDPLDDRQLVACASAVAQHYADRGHVHAQLAEPRVTMSDDGTALRVALEVDEGPSFRVGSVRVEGAGDTLPVLQLQAGQLFSRLHVDADRQALSRAHGARVEVDTHIDEQKKLIDVTLRVIAPP